LIQHENKKRGRKPSDENKAEKKAKSDEKLEVKEISKSEPKNVNNLTKELYSHVSAKRKHDIIDEIFICIPDNLERRKFVKLNRNVIPKDILNKYN